MNKELNEWELELQKKRDELQLCQKEHRIQSCSSCEKFLECEIRDDYVKSVYGSMSKGATGGFEF